MKIVLGLGNPGASYARTRHNVGFRVVDLVASRAHARFARDERAGDVCWTARIDVRGDEIVLAKPRTFMNRSGRAARALLALADAAASELLVVHDDADLELGRVRLRAEGGAGGHNGLRSIMDTLGTREFPRLKLGVRGGERDRADLADYVLEDFASDEEGVVGEMVDLGAQAVLAVLDEGFETAMNRFNARRPGTGP